MLDALRSTLMQLTWLPVALAAGALLWLWSGAKRWLTGGEAPLDADDARLAAAVAVAASVTLPALILGSCGILSWPAWLAGVIAIAALLHVWRPAAATGTCPEPAPAPSLAFVLLLSGTAIGLALFVLRNPLTDRDSLQYHLPMWAHWVRAGNLSVALRVPPEIYTAYPGGAELLQAFASWAARDDALAALPAVGALVLVALATRRLAVRWGAPVPLAEAGALLLLSQRAVASLGRSTQVDGLMTAWTLIALRFALRFRAHRAPRDLGIAVVALGLASGCRFTGPALAGLVLLATLAWPPAVPFAALRRVPWAACLLAMVFAAFWMVRNLIATGNPLYPAEISALASTASAPLSAERLRNTTQWAMWHQGFAGHLTAANLIRFYGGGLVLAGIGLLAPLARAHRRERVALLAFVLATVVLYVFSPFSGANLPSVGGHPPELAPDNVRYLLTSVALLVALGSATIPTAMRWPAVVVIAGLAAWQLGPMLARIAIGAALAAPVALALRTPHGAWPRSGLLRVAALVAISVAVVAVLRVSATSREGIVDAAWQGYREREAVRVFDRGLAAALRDAAGERTIAVVGLRSSYQLTGGDFRHHTVYVPVARDGEPDLGTFRWGRDDRTRPDRTAWTARIDALQPAFLALAYVDTVGRAIEAQWAADDTARFTRHAVNGRDTVYAIRRRP